MACLEFRLVIPQCIIFPLSWIIDSLVSSLPNLPWETKTGEGKEVYYLLSTVLGIFHDRKGHILILAISLMMGDGGRHAADRVAQR